MTPSSSTVLFTEFLSTNSMTKKVREDSTTQHTEIKPKKIKKSFVIQQQTIRSDLIKLQKPQNNISLSCKQKKNNLLT
jgi:hypothetical protein